KSFERIEKARNKTPLTYFEFNTLAAIDIFMQHKCDVIILETGLGGRLDAVNAWDTSVAIVVSVDLDHQNFLGDNIDKIAYEKAGIFRCGRPAIFGQKTPIKSIQQHAKEIGANLISYEQDFSAQRSDEKQWSFRFHPQNSSYTHKARYSLPIPALRGFYQIDNASSALAAIECLHQQLPVDIGAIRKGLLLAENPARFQVLAGRPIRVLDVGHNPHAARALKDSLRRLPFAEKRIAIFSILNDKDMASVVSILASEFDEWKIAPLDLPRGRSVENMLAEFDAVGINRNIIKVFPTIANAWQQTLTEAQENDRIVAFGSFHTVAQIVELIN
ncbi:MAG: bifunctional folylpolyglutamate synthase/dihydrofolate synthase, partial [Neisseriaceae bacterium]|nr:bifunctional folylpolyglutamate synthase/dihydrofolate synthase [Neisseriaceae bacterium]